MSLQQQERIKSLEARVEVLEGVIRQLVDCSDLASKPLTLEVIGEGAHRAAKVDLCPKCGVKPNKYFHTRSCTGK
jgi:hypothetical protein